MTAEPFPLAEIYLKVTPREIGFIKAIFESYECVGIIRTIDPEEGIIVIMAPGDFVVETWKILNSLRDSMEWAEVPRPRNIADDWLMREIHAGHA